jgi:hypothetical protein
MLSFDWLDRIRILRGGNRLVSLLYRALSWQIIRNPLLASDVLLNALRLISETSYPCKFFTDTKKPQPKLGFFLPQQRQGEVL